MESLSLLARQVTDGARPAVVAAGAGRLRTAQRVGLLAGSFNPLTLAHVALAKAAKRAAKLNITWALTVVTVDKERVTRASLPERLAQLDAYIGSTIRKGQSADNLVILGHGLYVEQAQAMRTLMAPAAELYIIVGFDKIVQIFEPRYYDDREAALRALFAQARLLVAPRDDQGEADLRALLARPENQPYAQFVTHCPLEPTYATDSSTEARQLAAAMSPAEIARPMTAAETVATGMAPGSVVASPALRRLLPPEGVALAATGAYAAQP